MDARTTASPTGVDEYVFYGEGGWSWSIPYVAGVYALAAQVEPSITPDRFWALALETGRTIDLQRGGKKHRFGRILDAAALVEAIRRGELADAFKLMLDPDRLIRQLDAEAELLTNTPAWLDPQVAWIRDCYLAET